MKINIDKTELILFLNRNERSTIMSKILYSKPPQPPAPTEFRDGGRLKPPPPPPTQK